MASEPQEQGFFEKLGDSTADLYAGIVGYGKQILGQGAAQVQARVSNAIGGGITTELDPRALPVNAGGGQGAVSQQIPATLPSRPSDVPAWVYIAGAVALLLGLVAIVRSGK